MVKIDDVAEKESLVIDASDRQYSEGFDDNFNEGMQVVPYCYFLRYARLYDNRWQSHLAKFEKIIMRHRTLFSPARNWPDEVAMNVVSYMDAVSLVTASRLNKQWHSLCADNGVWEYLCVHNYGISSELCNHSGNAKQLYRLMVHSLRSLVRKKQAVGGLSSLHLTLNMSNSFL